MPGRILIFFAAPAGPENAKRDNIAKMARAAVKFLFIISQISFSIIPARGDVRTPIRSAAHSRREHLFLKIFVLRPIDSNIFEADKFLRLRPNYRDIL